MHSHIRRKAVIECFVKKSPTVNIPYSSSFATDTHSHTHVQCQSPQHALTHHECQSPQHALTHHEDGRASELASDLLHLFGAHIVHSHKEYLLVGIKQFLQARWGRGGGGGEGEGGWRKKLDKNGNYKEYRALGKSKRVVIIAHGSLGSRDAFLLWDRARTHDQAREVVCLPGCSVFPDHRDHVNQGLPG